ncbi:MAG: valine--tRNA ligase [Bacilli bacterium]|nr:valine--tRNA ligase [Bacilli bacterium]
MSKELSMRYNHKEVEAGKYEKWLSNNCFRSGDKSKPAFCIVIPPPNVTGKLHLGHAWDSTLQDMIIRYKKMNGYDTLWLPGMDHAGIATQAKVEQKLREKGISRYDLGREKFLEQTWEWKKEYADFIRSQWAKLGLSLDYSKERFTLDEGLNDAVIEVFVTLYNKGLIYKGKRIINWDPVQRTALSNIEVIYEETESYLYYFKYRFVEDNDKYLLVATTRPETMFGDVCVVVNPNDSRYNKYIGKKVINPANNEELVIIGDDYVDINFGTGAMKCTPAHDANDFIIGEKYNLPKIICMNIDATMNSVCGEFSGLDRFECRNKLVEELKKKDLVEKIEKHVNQVGYSERSHAIVEPYLSNQWFVRMKPLAEKALESQNSIDKVQFIPERFEKIFCNWMENIEDWCISRQLWWGHRIPAWYSKIDGSIYVGKKPPLDIENYFQDEDVLDTWFSSALWPFSTLGWPKETEDYKRYFPTDALVTGYDIIFFWVSRMIFQSLEFTGKIPFKKALIHGLIRDSQGRKMSKSLGNGIDPMDVIDKYGADSLRHFLTTNSAPGLDLRYYEEKVEASWNFINKIWNAARFVMINLKEDFKYVGFNIDDLSLNDIWIIRKLNDALKSINENMEKYEFVVAGTYMYNFIWDDFCSWYIEMSKIDLNSTDSNVIKNTRNVLYYVLLSILKLIHPFMPFVSDEIYQKLIDDENSSLINSEWPNYIELNGKNDSAMQYIIEIIKLIRNYKNDNGLAPNERINLKIGIKNDNLRNDLNKNKQYLIRFGFIDNIEISSTINKDINGYFASILEAEIIIIHDIKINIEEEIARLKKDIEKLDNEIARCEGMLSNSSFIAKAPEAKIAIEKEKLENYKHQKESILSKIRKLEA